MSRTSAARIVTRSPEREIWAPITPAISSMTSTSRIEGTFSSTTSSSVKSAAAIIGSTAFLLPEARISPDRGRPP